MICFQIKPRLPFISNTLSLLSSKLQLSQFLFIFFFFKQNVTHLDFYTFQYIPISRLSNRFFFLLLVNILWKLLLFLFILFIHLGLTFLFAQCFQALEYPLLDPMVERTFCCIFLYHQTEKAMFFCLLFVAIFPQGTPSRLSYN